MKQLDLSTIVGIILALVIVAALIISGFYLIWNKEEAINDPETNLRTLILEINTGNASEIIDATAAVFSDDYDGSVAIVQSEIIESEELIFIVLNSHEIIYMDDYTITDQQKNDLTESVDYFEDSTNMNVQNSCVITYSMTITYGSESNTFNGDVHAIKVDSQWYLDIYFIDEFIELDELVSPIDNPPQSDDKTIVIELYNEQIPETCANFEAYVEDGFYDGLIFHRVIDDFMIQGGGYDSNMTLVTPTYPPINLEINSSLMHIDGAISMARTYDPNSATSQFFICDGSQPMLDNQYAVFGQVVSGMDIVRDISAVYTTSEEGHTDVPAMDVIITSSTLEIIDGKTYVTFIVEF